MKFPLDLVGRVRSSLERAGYCFLSSDEIERLLATVSGSRHARYRALLEFAEICGAEVETTLHLKSARFVLTESAPRNSMEAGEVFPRAAQA